MKNEVLDFYVSILESYVDQHNKTTDGKFQKYLKHGISNTMDKYGDCLDVNYVSVRVKEELDARGIDLENLGKTYHSWEVLGRVESGKKTLLWEHSTPKRVMRDRMLAGGDVRTILVEQYKITWLHRDEDNQLNASGYMSKVPNEAAGDDYNERYAAVGIELYAENIDGHWTPLVKTSKTEEMTLTEDEIKVILKLKASGFKF